MKILWHSVAPWVGTGYGVQTATFTPRIKTAGHDLVISAYYGLMGTTTKWRGIDVLPAYAKAYGTDILVPHAMHHFGGEDATGGDFRKIANEGVIITLGDVWTFDAPILPEMNVAAWVPIDHESLPPVVGKWFNTTGAVPIAMSRFGEKQLRDNGFDPIYVPHGVDSTVFCPGNMAMARDRIGIPQDAFVISLVAANIGRDGARKAFCEQITAFKNLYRQHNDAVLILHTDVSNPYGVDIKELLRGLPESAYYITDQYRYRIGVPAETVADFYRASDLYTNASWGEGFGITIVEAQRCGTPVVVTDTTAMSELVGSGWAVQGEQFWHDAQRAWARRPYIYEITDAYLEAYDLRANTERWQEIRAQAWTGSRAYDADNVMESFWLPALKRLEDALERSREDTQNPTTVTPPQTRLVESDGFLWMDRGKGYGDILGPANHERELWDIIEPLLPEDGTFLDIGAHVGHYAIRLSPKAGQVIAVEANPNTVDILRKNRAINDAHNVFVVNIAAWDEFTTLYLTDPNHQTAGGSTRTVEESTEGVPVTANALDDLDDIWSVARDGIHLVKMDVEGADLHALRGMRKLLATYHPVLFIECHDYCGYYDRRDLESLLTELGYDFEVVYSYQSQWTPNGVRPDPVPADYLVCRWRVVE